MAISRSSILLTFAVLLSSPAGAQPIHVTDGDTIKLNGTSWRLWGIDAPEMHQACADGWPAGVEATLALGQLTAGRAILCDDRGHDRYGRTIGLCRADGEDLSAAMVRGGMAWAFVRYSRDYVELEEKARTQGIGVHAHICQLPWEWRPDRR